MRIHSSFPTEHPLPDRLDFCALYYDDKGYRLHVTEFSSNRGEVFEINFGHAPLAQRSMDEGSFLSMSWTSDESNGPVGAVTLVTGSDFLEWFHEQSCHIYSRDEVKHVAVLTQNDWFEVLCRNLPTIRLIAHSPLPADSFASR